MVAHFGLDVVEAYMGHVQDNAEESVRRAIEALKDAEYVYPMDPDFDGAAARDPGEDHGGPGDARRRGSTSPARPRSSRPTTTRRSR